MQRLLELMARAVSRRPALVLAALAAATAVLGLLGLQQEVETDITEFSAESELTEVFDRIEDEFGARGGSIQIIVDAGQGGNVLSADGLRLADDLVELAGDVGEVDAALREGTDRSPAVVSYATPILPQVAQLGVELADLSDPLAASVVQSTVEGQGAGQLEGLVSDDADLDEAEARGGLVVLQLAADLEEGQATEASAALQDALAERETGWFDVEPFSLAILTVDIEEGLLDDLPLLMGLSFALIILILSVLFRSFADVAFGVVGLVLTIVWMNGLAVLLGPEMLGLTGPFNQIAVAVPVLLVGLGIDYSVHLNARYREERTAGSDAPLAAATAVRTVGVALLLATVTTVIGFLSNLATPLPPIADFGAFAAAGIASAFVVMGLLIPSARNLIDRRRRPPLPHVTEGHSAEEAPTGFMARVAALPARAPWAVLAAFAALAGIGGWAATDLDTSFSQEEFIPEHSNAAALLDRMDLLFGGDVSEQTFVLVEGDLTDPGLLNEILEVTDDLGEVDDVVTADDEAEVQSPPTVVAGLERTVEAVRLQLSAQFALLDDPDDAAEDLPLPETLTVEDLPAAFLDDAAADGIPLGDGDLDALERRLPEGISAVEALLSALPGAELAAAVREGAVEQLEDEGPDGVSDDAIAGLAALDADEIDRVALEGAGWPTDELPDDALDLLDAAERIGGLGWDGDRFAADADVEAIYEEVRAVTGGDLDAVLGDDGQSGLLIIGSQAGEQRAEALAAELTDRLAAVEAAGATTAVASEQLVIIETLDELADAQIGAIVISLGAALLLLGVYYGVTARRPMLGVVTMIPPILAVPLILGSMRVAGLAFNALTATVASIAVGIGVPYGIHLTNRYLEQRERGGTPEQVAGETIRHTGAALVGSAVTTASGFGVLVFSGLEPIRQFGGVTSVTILYALVAAVLAEAAGLVVWDRHHRKRDGATPDGASEDPEIASAGAPAVAVGAGPADEAVPDTEGAGA